MNRRSIARTLILILPILAAARLPAQSMDDLNLQVHGYATQGFLYSNHNSWNGTDSQNGSAAWTEAVVNLSLQPQPKLRIGIQARYYLLGDFGDQIILDWAQIDYRFNGRFGFRVGDVKTPTGLLNETQDIDPAHLWSLLPQSVYPIASRDSLLDHYGGVVYGAIPLGEHNKLEYRGYGGTRVIGANDAVFTALLSNGFTVPNGMRGPIYGATLKWHTPLPGLMLGATLDVEKLSGEINLGSLDGTFLCGRATSPYYFGRYEKSKLMVAGEYSRALAPSSTINLPGFPAIPSPIDYRTYYVMASYKLSSKLTAGAYYSSFINRRAPVSSSRFQKDWTISARYDFNSFLYAKAEQHFMDGTAVGFNASDNPNLQPTTRLSILKLGVTF